jgi:hypothetical protein
LSGWQARRYWKHPNRSKEFDYTKPTGEFITRPENSFVEGRNMGELPRFSTQKEKEQRKEKKTLHTYFKTLQLD